MARCCRIPRAWRYSCSWRRGAGGSRRSARDVNLVGEATKSKISEDWEQRGFFSVAGCTARMRLRRVVASSAERLDPPQCSGTKQLVKLHDMSASRETDTL